jgi:hypothetical protein
MKVLFMDMQKVIHIAFILRTHKFFNYLQSSGTKQMSICDMQ